MKQYDVVIAGGAMAGATLALAIEHLSQETLRIAVVEPFKAQSDAHPGFDSRSIALSYGTVNLLRHLQLWSVIEPFATSIEHIHVSDRSHAGMTEITRQEVGVEALGYVVELADVGRVYQDLLAKSACIDFFCPDSVTYIEREQEHTNVELSSGEKLVAKLLVAADGAVSQCCQQVGLELSEHDFEQVAVIANIVAQEPHQGRAFERFTENGPVALLPMSDNRMSLVWCLIRFTFKAVSVTHDRVSAASRPYFNPTLHLHATGDMEVYRVGREDTAPMIIASPASSAWLNIHFART